MRIHTKLIILSIFLVNGVLLIFLVRDHNKQYENLRQGVEIERAMQGMQSWQPRHGVLLVEHVRAPIIQMETQFRSAEVKRLLGGNVSIYFAYIDQGEWKFAREDFQIRSGHLDGLLDLIRPSPRQLPPSENNTSTSLNWNEAKRKTEQSNKCEQFLYNTGELRQKLDKMAFTGEDMRSWLATTRMCQSLKRVVVWVSPNGSEQSVLKVDKDQRERNSIAQHIRKRREQDFFENVLPDSP
ncbi:hypothetical protein [Marinicellulosiphila megalodicopiae]|uniref:hypothetical protein n=1 Tax=Marinicellulosiphila megalodicopiae TaxID=2724896 RepID=UPI003BAE67B4